MKKDELGIVNRVIELAMEIQQIAAPTFEEGERAGFVRAKFAEAGLSDVEIDATGNVYARSRGGDASPLVVSAHLDTVFPRETSLLVKREAQRVYGPGIGDNSMGVAALFGLAWHLRESGARPSGDIWFAANTCEEGLGDLRGMKAVVDRFGANVTGYLVLEGAALGHIYHRGVGVQRYKISAKAAGGHAWSDYGAPSAIHELAKLTAKIASLELPKSPRTTLNVGRIFGGTSINTIAAEAWLELDMRSESPASLAELVAAVDALIEAATRPEVRVEAMTIGARPAGEISASHPFVNLAVGCTRAQGMDAILVSGSTDANVPLSRGMPAVVMGVTRGGGAHTINEFVETEYVERGLAALGEFVEKAFGG
jgi:acetylornithine deacetylase/succinyl-diaminopimelate desuccinylase-like protein